jgi:glycosyltransferase involved in cell wall biosynthesis
MSPKSIAFISNGGADHATEELWSRAAVNLAGRGFSIVASVPGWSRKHWRAQFLEKAAIQLQVRPAHYTVWTRAWQHFFFRRKTNALIEVERLFRSEPPSLVLFSNGPFPPIELLELCVSKKLPFATIANGNDDHSWPEDPLAERYRKAFTLARRCYFVATANLRLTEKQIGAELPNAEVVWSQYNVEFNSLPAWPESTSEAELSLACVGRLYPPHKGQDILLEALAGSAWQSRPWRLSFYGQGPMRNVLERMVNRFNLTNRVTFAGHVPVKDIWSANHALVMPSRVEGRPLSIIEAMLCGRAVVATNVGGNSEMMVDGVTGFLVGPPSVDNMATGLERLWTKRNSLKEMGQEGAKRIREMVPSDPIRVFADKIIQLLA